MYQLNENCHLSKMQCPYLLTTLNKLLYNSGLKDLIWQKMKSSRASQGVIGTKKIWYNPEQWHFVYIFSFKNHFFQVISFNMWDSLIKMKSESFLGTTFPNVSLIRVNLEKNWEHSLEWYYRSRRNIDYTMESPI